MLVGKREGVHRTRCGGYCTSNPPQLSATSHPTYFALQNFLHGKSHFTGLVRLSIFKSGCLDLRRLETRTPLPPLKESIGKSLGDFCFQSGIPTLARFQDGLEKDGEESNYHYPRSLSSFSPTLSWGTSFPFPLLLPSCTRRLPWEQILNVTPGSSGQQI